MSKVPSHIQLHKQSKTIDLVYGEEMFTLSCEYLRVYSPSAEVRGHGQGQETLQTGKKDVCITGIEPSGNYGLKIVFDDGHDSGIYTWSYLTELCTEQEPKWQDYLDRMHKAGASRIKNASVVTLQPPLPPKA